MARKSWTSSLVILSVLLVICSLLDVSTATSSGKAYRVLNPTEPRVIELGKFAITEENKKENTHLVFDSVVSAGQQDEPSWKVYTVTIAAKDGETLNKYFAIVLQRHHACELQSFRQLKEM